MSDGKVFNLADFKDGELINTCRAITAQAESGEIRGIITLIFDDYGGAELAVAGRCLQNSAAALQETAHFLSLLREQSKLNGSK